MELSTALNLSSNEKELLCSILECKEAELEDSLAINAKAALEEYIRMFLGQKFLQGVLI